GTYRDIVAYTTNLMEVGFSSSNPYFEAGIFLNYLNDGIAFVGLGNSPYNDDDAGMGFVFKDGNVYAWSRTAFDDEEFETYIGPQEDFLRLYRVEVESPIFLGGGSWTDEVIRFYYKGELVATHTYTEAMGWLQYSEQSFHVRVETTLNSVAEILLGHYAWS